MGSLSKDAVMRAINEEAEGQRTRKEEPRKGGLAGAVFEKIGGMISPKRKGGARANRGDYLRYVEEEQSGGRKAKTYAEWASEED